MKTRIPNPKYKKGYIILSALCAAYHNPPIQMVAAMRANFGLSTYPRTPEGDALLKEDIRKVWYEWMREMQGEYKPVIEVD